MSSARVTPPPECSIAPQTTTTPSDACAALRAWHWDGCPAGFSPACSTTDGVASHTQPSVSWSTGWDNSLTPLTATERWETAVVGVLCCPTAGVWMQRSSLHRVPHGPENPCLPPGYDDSAGRSNRPRHPRLARRDTPGGGGVRGGRSAV
ncbi:hypothetical protein CCHR01_19486 [Colletotrichum chrysophilum]|uniref:Uncharacterized protein n=1 Tax=Colletotrichum chrysophilum TaxID=1836956 RepID=A0AAD9E7S1_9PEZI|nr:hypothetical protein CCHR01_19486 [Colletotrichum chrysophilum]